MKTRREFIKLSIYSGAAALSVPGIIACASKDPQLPAWLSTRKDQNQNNPHLANLEWFKTARFGLYLHYGLYSLPGRSEWVQFTEKIPVRSYEKLKDEFYAREFNPDFITDLIKEAGMNYLNVVVKHHDSFCLWDTGVSEFKSTASPARRDIVGELSVECKKKDIALFLGYSHGRDWRHPHAPNRDTYKSYSTRPAYNTPEQYYKYGEDHDLGIYTEFVQNQVRELLSNYGDIAGIWFGGASTILSGPVDPFNLTGLFDMIHKLQSHALIAYGPGVTGTEDITSVLRKLHNTVSTSKFIEISDTMQPRGWGYASEEDGKHKKADQVIAMLDATAESGCNLLLNTGPLPGGKIHSEDIATLKKVGRHLRRKGFPEQ